MAIPHGIHFWIPDVTTVVDDEELAVLVKELRKIAIGSATLEAARALADSLSTRLRPLGPGVAKVEPDSAERFRLVRAIDHLRNVGHRGELLTLRDRLRATDGVGWIAYRLRVHDARPDQDFTSYSGPYEPGDRLVTPSGEQLRVIEVERAGDDEILVCELWRDPEPS